MNHRFHDLQDFWNLTGFDLILQGRSGLANLQYVVWLDITREALGHLHERQPQLRVIASHEHPLLQRRPPAAADPRAPLDQPHAEAVSQFGWAAAAAKAREGGGGDGATRPATGSAAPSSGPKELTLADRFRCDSERWQPAQALAWSRLQYQAKLCPHGVLSLF